MRQVTKSKRVVIISMVWLILTVTSLIITHQYLVYAKGEITGIEFEGNAVDDFKTALHSDHPRVGWFTLMGVSKAVESAGNAIIEQVNAFEIVEENEVEETRYVDIYKVNVREEPSLNSDVLTTLVATEDIDVVSHVVTDRNEEWIRVNMVDTDSYGYIMKEYTTTEAPWICIGYYHITWYCPCEKCCDVANRPTASGKMPTAGRTVAADTSLPFGTEVIIEGHTYTVEDRGGGYKRKPDRHLCANARGSTLTQTENGSSLYKKICIISVDDMRQSSYHLFTHIF